MEVKVCTKCKGEYPATTDYFHKSTRNKDGLNDWCKNCRNQYIRNWDKQNPDKRRKIANKYRRANMKKFREYAKNDRLKHPDKFKNRDRQQYLKHRNKRLEYQQQYRKAHKKEVELAHKRWREKNKEYVYLKNKEWRMKNYTRYRAAIKRWLEENPDKKRRYYHVREARKKSLLATFNPKQWKYCKSYFSYSCAYCGRPSQKLHQEHFIPINNGGTYTITNIIPACRKCNSSKKDSSFFDWYSKQPFYSKTREAKILKYLNYDKQGQCQQLSIFDSG